MGYYNASGVWVSSFDQPAVTPPTETPPPPVTSGTDTGTGVWDNGNPTDDEETTGDYSDYWPLDPGWTAGQPGQEGQADVPYSSPPSTPSEPSTPTTPTEPVTISSPTPSPSPPPAAPPATPATPEKTWDELVAEWQTALASIGAALRAKYDAWIASMQGVLGEGVPSAPDLSGYIQSIGSLTTQLAAGPGQYQDEAAQYRAEMLGYQDITNPDGTVTTAAQQYNNDLQRMKGMTTANAPGLSQEERDRMERYKQSNIQGLEERAQRQLESLMGSRGGMGYLSAADEYRKQISDVNLQYDLEIAESDYARKVMEIQRNDQQYALQVQQGNALASDYLNMRQQGIKEALNGYLAQAATEMQQYQGQIQEITTHADLIYKAAMLDMGADQAIMEQLSEQFEMMIAPYVLQAQMAQMNAATNAQNSNIFFNILGLGLKVAAAAITGQWWLLGT